MSISRDTFDPSKGYKRLRFHQRRDLLDSELNEQQDIALHERRQLFDVLVPQGAIAQGLAPTITGAQVTLTAGQVYCDGHLLSVPGAVLEYDPGKTSGIDYVWLEVLRLAIDANEDPTLVNPMTGEPTAEREQWLVTLKSANTGGDALPAHGLGRTTVALYAFDRGTGAITPTVAAMLSAQDKPRWDAHLGAGGNAHPPATSALAGFMSAGDKVALDGHLGAGGAAHALATPEAAGFMGASDRQLLTNLGTAYAAGLIQRPDLLDLTYYEVYWRLNQNRTTPAAFFDYSTDWTQDPSCYTVGPDILPYHMALKGALHWHMPIPGSGSGCAAFITRAKYLGTADHYLINCYFVDDTVRLFISETWGNWSAWTQVQVGDTTVSDPYISSGYHNNRYFRVPVLQGKTYFFMFILNNTNDGSWGVYLDNFILNADYGFQFAPQWPLW